MLRPFIFVGCGGSGVRTVHKIRQELAQELREHGYTGAFPRAWQFLTIDVPSTNQAGAGSTEIPYIGLADSAIKYKGPNSADETLANREVSMADYLEWRPNPAHVHVNLEIGAGQYRAIGRVAAATWGSKKVGGRISDAASACTDDWLTLDAVAKSLGIQVHSGAERPTPYVVLISSLGGGAGSGIFLDVADMIRLSASGATPWLQSGLIGVLYDPSVFDSGNDPVAQKGIPGNSLAAVSELVAAQWNPWSVSPHLTGFNGNLGNYAGPEYAFLVGSSNGEVDFSTPDDVYDATARAISAWALNPLISTKMDEITLGNWAAESAKSTLEFHQPDGVSVRNPLSAIGYARVDLGRTRFGLYAEERLTREAVEHMLTCHVDSRVETGKLTSDEAATERVVQNDYALVYRFLDQCGLNEDSVVLDAGGTIDSARDNNQVLDGIRDQARLQAESTEKVGKVLGQVTSTKTRMQQFDQAWNDEFTGWSATIKAHHTLSGVRWAEAVQETVIDAVIESIALNGLLVTQKLLTEVQKRIGTTFPEQLIAEKSAGPLKTWAKAWESRHTRAEILNASNKETGKARSAMESLLNCYIYVEVERDLRDIAAVLLRDMAKSFFEPLINALESVRQQLAAEFGSAKVSDLASSTVVPARLLPTKTELWVANPAGFPQLYDDLIMQSAGTTQQALVNIIQAHLLPDTDPRSLAIDLQPTPKRKPWVPTLAEQLLQPRPRAAASFEFALATEPVRARARYWLTADHTRSIGKYLTTTISDYLLEEGLSEPAREARIKEFCKLLEEAFRKAKPLADVKWDWTTAKMGLSKQQGTIRYLSKIPLTPPTQQMVSGKVSAAEEIGKVISSELGTNSVGDYFSPSNATSIDVFSMLKPLPPSGFLSLSKPIIESKSHFDAMGNAASAGDEFWLNRVARPMLDALPMPTAVRDTYARGWLTGLLTGRIEFATDPSGVVDLTKPITVMAADNKTKLAFAHPSLGVNVFATPERFRKVAALSIVLNSALLAEMQAASGGSDSAMRALIELLRLGTASGDGIPRSNYGAGLHHQLKAKAKDLGDDGHSTLADLCVASATQVEEHVAHHNANPSSWSPFPPEIAIGKLYINAARELATAITTEARQAAQASGPINPLLG